MPRVEDPYGAIVVESVAGARARGLLALEPRGRRVGRVPVAQILRSTIDHTFNLYSILKCVIQATFQSF